ncbi:MAG: dihydroneopterin aldolase [Zoogloeaceae bacterium]|jgi:dihydroneopterin aldolase|nr:dihydroneopterin aldolase [Zoogloeaceae bacterium]
MDIIFIEDLRVETCVGIHPREQAAPQTVALDIRMGIASAASARRVDDIRDTVDYAAVCECLRAELSARRFNLLETLAEFAASQILKSFAVPWVRLSVAKLGAMRDVKRVGVLIERVAEEAGETSAKRD